MIKIYLAIPYTGMEESSFKQANEAAAVLMRNGYAVFSPITQGHAVTRENELPKDWSFWKNKDFPWIDVCDFMVVLVPEEGMEPVRKSIGVQCETTYAECREIRHKKRTLQELIEHKNYTHVVA